MGNRYKKTNGPVTKAMFTMRNILLSNKEHDQLDAKTIEVNATILALLGRLRDACQ